MPDEAEEKELTPAEIHAEELKLYAMKHPAPEGQEYVFKLAEAGVRKFVVSVGAEKFPVELVGNGPDAGGVWLAEREQGKGKTKIAVSERTLAEPLSA